MALARTAKATIASPRPRHAGVSLHSRFFQYQQRDMSRFPLPGSSRGASTGSSGGGSAARSGGGGGGSSSGGGRTGGGKAAGGAEDTIGSRVSKLAREKSIGAGINPTVLEQTMLRLQQTGRARFAQGVAAFIVLIGSVGFFLGDYLKDEIADHTAEVATKSISNPELAKQSEAVAKQVVSSVLTDAATLEQVQKFLLHLFGQEYTVELLVALVLQVGVIGCNFGFGSCCVVFSSRFMRSPPPPSLSHTTGSARPGNAR